MYITPDTQRAILNAAAKCGSRKMAIEQTGVNYTDLLELFERDPSFEQKLKDAEKFFSENLNSVIQTMALKRLYETLLNGVTHVTTHSEEMKDGDENVIGTRTKITKKYQGVPMSAIKEGIALIPPIEKVMNVLAANSAIPTENLEKLQSIVLDYQQNLRELMSGKQESKELTNEVLAALQQALTGSQL